MSKRRPDALLAKTALEGGKKERRISRVVAGGLEEVGLWITLQIFVVLQQLRWIRYAIWACPRLLTLMLLVANVANTKRCKKNPWKMTETLALIWEYSESYPMNTNMTGFRWLPKIFGPCAEIASALEGLTHSCQDILLRCSILIYHKYWKYSTHNK